MHVSTNCFVFDVTCLNTENYMVYIAFLQCPDLKKKKKKKKKAKKTNKQTKTCAVLTHV